MNHKWIIVGMMCVTMLPRIIPFYAFKTEDLPPLFRRFLGYIPYTVLGALILPGGLEGIAGKPVLSGICLGVAAVVAWMREGIIGPVIGAVLTGVAVLQLS